IANAILMRVDTGNAQYVSVRVGPVDTARYEPSAAPVGAIAAAISGGKQDVRTRPRERAHCAIKGMVRIVRVIARSSDGEIPTRIEHPPAISHYQGMRVPGPPIREHTQQKRVCQYGIAEQAVHNRPARARGGKHS